VCSETEAEISKGDPVALTRPTPKGTRLIDDHLGGSIDHQRQLCNQLMLELWYRVCVDTSMTSGAKRVVSAAAF
jgi:hypothetical protein